ncbi:MAG: tryptophan 2,3-dioxygenase family protein [Gemmatimonadales bacterium]|nr:tryptophan 2,3-dioxygenase family protein [Gemmatimonadales bacterium]
MALTYSKYLKLDQLLGLQAPRSDPEEHDEMLFIVIHQVYELWFKLLLHEIDRCKREFTSNEIFAAIARFKRMRTVLKTLVEQIDILETMSPLSFLAFRDRLETASGFQSAQFRQVEFVLGFKRPEMLKHYEGEGALYEAVAKRLHERSLVDHFYDLLAALGIDIPDELRNKDVTAANGPHEAIQDAIIRIYEVEPAMLVLVELMTDFDEGLQEWRYRHVKMVERTIGNQRGTGGSPGVEFLKQSLFQPVFPDLWAIRSKL